MSWVERIKSEITIKTGDGKIYTPLYVLLPKSIEWNIAKFEFPNIKGTLVKRSELKGRKFPIEIIFQGDDHVERSLEFEQSAIDKRPWVISHPIYDDLLVHPESLTFDPTGLNTMVITGQVTETIKDEGPVFTIDASDKTSVDAALASDTAAVSFAADVIPETSDINLMGDNIGAAFSLGAQSVKSGDQSNEYFNLFTVAQSSILNAANDIATAATAMNDVLIYPYLFKDSVESRLSLLRNQFDALAESVVNLVTPNEKKIYETNSNAIVNAMILASINPLDDDYGSVKSVNSVIDQIVDVNNIFFENLDFLQTDNGGGVDSYIPDFAAISALSNLINFALSQLFVIAENATQQRTLILEVDSNPILLAHRFYGLSVDDLTIESFLTQNNIGLSELLEIKAGETVVYFV